MLNWKERLLEEHNEVRTRTSKLKEFLANYENSVKMDMHDWNFLIVQKDIMVSYLSILETRMIKLELLPMEEE